MGRGGEGKEERGKRLMQGVEYRYFPVVAVIMFWPYAVPPIMELAEDNW
jgi:hypothetical protein